MLCRINFFDTSVTFFLRMRIPLIQVSDVLCVWCDGVIRVLTDAWRFDLDIGLSR